MGIIYCAENLANGKKYIGKTLESLEKRKGRHFQNAFRYNRQGRFYDALRKYGWDSFFWIIIEENIIDENLDSREIFFIHKFGTFGKGYNMTEGGSVLQGYKHSQKTKDKISCSNRGISNKERFIKLLGAKEGSEKYNNYIESIKNKNGKGKARLQLFIERNGEQLGRELYEKFILSIKEARKRKGSTNTIKDYIERYGEEEGNIKYLEFCNKLRNKKRRK